MTVSLWRSTVTATLERSTAWCAADRRQIGAARVTTRVRAITASSMTAGRREFFLLPVLLSIAAGILASCVPEPPAAPPTTAAAGPRQPSLPQEAFPPAVRRPPRKPTPTPPP